MNFLRKLSFAEFFCLTLALLCFSYYFWISYMSFYHALPADISEIKIAVIGIGSSVVGFVVGSTAGSRKKDEAIANMNENIKGALASTPPVNTVNDGGEDPTKITTTTETTVQP